MDRIQSEKEAKEVVIWLSKSKHILIQAECFYSCNVIIVFLLTGFCIQTNNILFVAMVVNYSEYSISHQTKKSCPTNDCRAAFLLFVI